MCVALGNCCWEKSVSPKYHVPRSNGNKADKLSAEQINISETSFFRSRIRDAHRAKTTNSGCGEQNTDNVLPLPRSRISTKTKNVAQMYGFFLHTL
jgi:hypothetical protein